MRPPDDAVLPVLQEQLQVQKVERVTGVVQVRKTVAREELQFELPPLQRVEIDVERVPIGRVVDEPAATRTEGEVTIVPVHEERWVMTRQLVLTEEVHLRRRRTTVTAPAQSATLRREQVEVARLPAVLDPAPPLSARPAAHDAASGDSSPDERNPSP